MATSALPEESLSPTTRIRHLKPKWWRKLVNLLTERERWLEIACKIRNPYKKEELMFSTQDISILENQWKRNIAPADAFLRHWSTSGRTQPNIQDLIDLLLDCRQVHAADFISREFLNVPLNTVETMQISSEEIIRRISLSSDQKDQETHDATINDNSVNLGTKAGDSLKACNETDISELHGEMISDENVTVYDYQHLARITGNFCDISIHNGGYKVGEGAFGVVYRAYDNGVWIAIKKLKEIVDKQFFNELEVLKEYKHENLLPLLGYSNDGPYSCLIYTYMNNGCLQERLACLEGSAPIPWMTRMKIACGIARGINHLHTFGSQPLIHRDIKSANVLLDNQLVPKVGDFGLAKLGKSSTTTSVSMTSNVFGTSVYMAREAFIGQISVKLDSFSYGVVLMEIITGLQPYDVSREEMDLVSYMEDNCRNIDEVPHLLDVKAGDWNLDIAKSLYEISKRCIETRRKDRPTIAEVLPDLENLSKQC